MKRAIVVVVALTFGLTLIGPLTPLSAIAGQSVGLNNVQVSISWNAEQLYERALRVDDSWWEPGESAIHITRGIVVQNDSPGCGRRDDDAGVFEEISGTTVLSKDLDISGAPPKRAQLAFIGAEKRENTAELEVEVNGKVVLVRSP